MSEIFEEDYPQIKLTREERKFEGAFSQIKVGRNPRSFHWVASFNPTDRSWREARRTVKRGLKSGIVFDLFEIPRVDKSKTPFNLSFDNFLSINPEEVSPIVAFSQTPEENLRKYYDSIFVQVMVEMGLGSEVYVAEPTTWSTNQIPGTSATALKAHGNVA